MAHATETSVKVFHSGMQSAPYPTSGTPSTSPSDIVVSILKACLVDGFNPRTFDSIVVTSGIARATRALGHGFVFDQIVNVSGATPAGLNGDKRVLVATTTYIEFDAAGIADGSASGTIEIKTAPAGWDAPFSSQYVLVLRSPNTMSQRSFYRLDEGTGDRGSRVIKAYRDMTDIDNGTNQWAQLNFGSSYNLTPSYSPAWGNGRWLVIADNATVWMFHVATATVGNAIIQAIGFGSFASFKANDNRNEFIQGGYPGLNNQGYVNSGGGLFGAIQTTLANVRTALAESGAGVSGSNYVGGFGAYNVNIASGYTGPTFPSPVNNGLMLSDSLLRETSDNAMRGKNRGCYWCMQDRPLPATCPGLTVTGISGLEGRTLMLVPFTPQNSGSAPSPAQDGRIAIDITGPWE